MPKYKGVYQKRNKFYYVIRNKWIGGFDTPELARDAREKELEVTPDKPGAGTFKAFYQKFFDLHLVTKSKSYQVTCNNIIRKHAIPDLGNKKLIDISVMDIMAVMGKVSKRVSITEANKMLGLLSVIFNKAVEWDFIIKAPTIKMKKLKETKREYVVLEENQLSELINSLKGEDRYIVAIAGLAGARMGECLGFQWRDIDFKENTISFKRQMTRWGVSDTLKSSYSKTTLPMLPALNKLLQEWKEQCNGDTWLFPDKRNKEKPLEIATFFQRWHRTISKTVPKGFRFHDLRHTFASYLITKGKMPKVIQTLMRHANIGITMDRYGHIFPNQLKEEIEGLDFDV